MQAWDKFFEIKHACKEKQHQPEVIQELLNKLFNDVQIISEELAEYINSPSWNRPAFYFDDDDDEESSILGFSDSNDDSTSIDDDSFSIDDIDYVEESPPDSDLCFNLEESSRGSTTTRSDLSLPDYEAFYYDDDHIEEKSSGSTTTHSDFSLSKYDSFSFDLSINPFPPADRSDYYHEEFADELTHIISPSEYDCFYFKIKPELGDFTMDVVEDIFYNPTREPRNKIFDPVIFIEVQSKRFLSPNKFSISFIRDPLSLLFDTLLPFSSENEDNIFNPGILASNEEKSPHLLSHRSFTAFQLISGSPMMISGGDIPILDVPFIHFYPP
ncbi:hypothetical protein Tco_0622353 [Tanacetum coccineum]